MTTPLAQQQKRRWVNSRNFLWCSLSSLPLPLWQSLHNQWVSSHLTDVLSNPNISILLVILHKSQIGSETWWKAFLPLLQRGLPHQKGDLVQKLHKCCRAFSAPAKANWLNAQTWTHLKNHDFGVPLSPLREIISWKLLRPVPDFMILKTKSPYLQRRPQKNKNSTRLTLQSQSKKIMVDYEGWCQKCSAKRGEC